MAEDPDRDQRDGRITPVERTRQWRRENPERHRDYMRDYMREYMRQYRKERREASKLLDD